MITGLCRGFKNFNEGDRYVYVTRLCREAVRERGLDPKCGPWYLGVASMIVMSVESSHEQAARRFSRRRYVAVPEMTPYPPGLAHNAKPAAAVSRESCIVHPSRNVSLTPSRSKPEEWLQQYSDYHQRQKDKQLRAAFCKFETIRGREALITKFEDAPVMSSKDWEGKTQNVAGRVIQNTTGEQLAAQIAAHGYEIP